MTRDVVTIGRSAELKEIVATLEANGIKRVVVAEDGKPLAIVGRRDLGGGVRRVVSRNEIDIKPIRTVEQLAGGNLLLGGGEDIVEVDPSGAVVWHVRIFNDLGRKIRHGVYKGVRVAR